MASSGQDPGENRPPDDNKHYGDKAAPKTLQGLLKFAVENTPPMPAIEGGGHSSAEPAVSVGAESTEERAAWLRNVMSSMYKDEVKEMGQFLHILKEGCELRANNDASGHDNEEGREWEEKMTEALENLLDLVDGIDNARDFIKIGGGDILQPLFRDPSSEVRWRTLDLMASLSQNHPSNQEKFQGMGMVHKLLDIVDSEDVDLVRVKALYALSCLSRDNDSCHEDFVHHDGFSVLIRAMQSDVEKLQIKAAFMLQAMLTTHPQHKDTLHNMGMVHQLVALLQQQHASTHEHFMLALLNLVSDHAGCQTDCSQPELRFEELLNERMEFVRDKEEFQEELEYCTKLMAICFPKTPDTRSGMDR